MATSAAAQGTKLLPGMTERADEKGRPYMLLPRLNPVDCYYLYNPDNYFRGE